MKAAVLTEFDAPYQIKEVADPTPGDGEVLIAVHACGLCHTDLHVKHGVPFGVLLPLVGGHEPVGVIKSVGPGVSRLKIGDRVGVSWWQGGCGRCDLCQRDHGRYCLASKSWLKSGGGNGALMIADERGVALLPDAISFEDAAPIFCAGYTVVSGYRNAAPRPGERVAVLGIGGLGHLAVQYAKAFGHEVLAVTNTPDKRAFAKQLGADEVVITGDHVGKALSKAGGADIILSTTNSIAQASQSTTGLRDEGRLILMGVGAERLSLNSSMMLGRQISIKGSMQNAKADLIDALDLVARGKVKPMLELFPIDQINEASERLERGEVRFRAVLQHAV